MDKLRCAQSVAITRGRRWVSFESRIDTNDDSALLGLIECDEETGISSGWQTGGTLCDWTTFDGLVTAAYWTFAMMTVDSSRDRWAYGTPGGLGIVPVAPTVTFGGQTIYFDTINTAQVRLNPDDGPSPRQPRIAVTNFESLEWEQVAWSREVWIADYETSTGMARRRMDIPVRHLPHDGQECPSYNHLEILQPLEHTTVRVKLEMAEPVQDAMVGTLHREAVTKRSWGDQCMLRRVSALECGWRNSR